MSTNPPSGGPDPTLTRIRTGEKISTSDANEDALQGLRASVSNGRPGDEALALNKIRLALSNISSNLSQLVPVERRHVVPPAVAALVHLFLLMQIRQPIGDAISPVFFIILLASFAWFVWTTLKFVDHRLDEINAKMNVLQHSLTSTELLVSRPQTLDYVPIVHPTFSDTVEEAPAQREPLELNVEPIELREAPHPIEQLKHPVNVEEPEHHMPSDIPEPERHDERPSILDQADLTLVALVPTAPDESPAIADSLDSTPTLVGSGVRDEQDVGSPTASVSPVPLEPTGHIGQAIPIFVKPNNEQPEPPFSHWSSHLLEIKQRIEPLTPGTSQKLPPMDQRNPVLVALRRTSLRLLMYCASLSTADFASPNGFLGPPDCVPYYPTGDPEGDRNVAFITALDCLDELMALLNGNAKAEIAAALSELAQALNDLGLHEYASSVSGLALEILRNLYTAEPDQFRSRLASIQILRASILADLRQNDDAAGAAEEAVTILKEDGDTQLEFVYSMLNYAVLLGSIGRGEGAAAVAFELMGHLDDSISPQSDTTLISPLCQLCVSNACIEVDSDLALAAADKAIEASRVSMDANSKVVLAGALLTKSKILSSRRQNDAACSISAEAVTIFRSASVDHHVFSLLLAHTLSTHSLQLVEANRKGESYSTTHEAVELWQALHCTAPVATKRPLAWALFELAKYHGKDANRQTLRNELQIAEFAVSTFREVSPLDCAGLAHALYLCGKRMFEIDNSRDAATYAEEAVQYFREARKKLPHKYALELIFSLSLASSCLACTERSMDALKYAQQAVEVHREPKDDRGTQYDNHLHKLLMDVVHRFTEMGRQEDALPWMQELQELQHLGMTGDTGNLLGPQVPQIGTPQPKNDSESGKHTKFWTNASDSAPKLDNNSISSVGARTPPAAQQLDQGSEEEVARLAVPSTSAPQVGRDKAKEVIPGNPSSPSSNAHFGSGSSKNILGSLLSMGGRKLGGAASLVRSRNEDPLSGLLGMGGMDGRTLGSASGPNRTSINDRLSGLFDMGGMGEHTLRTPSSPPPAGPAGRPLGSPIQLTVRAPPLSGYTDGRLSGIAGHESLLGGLGSLGPGGGLDGQGGGEFDPGMLGPGFFDSGSHNKEADRGNAGIGTEGGGDDTARSGTWSGVGIPSRLSDDSA